MKAPVCTPSPPPPRVPLTGPLLQIEACFKAHRPNSSAAQLGVHRGDQPVLCVAEELGLYISLCRLRAGEQQAAFLAAMSAVCWQPGNCLAMFLSGVCPIAILPIYRLASLFPTFLWLASVGLVSCGLVVAVLGHCPDK